MITSERIIIAVDSKDIKMVMWTSYNQNASNIKIIKKMVKREKRELP